MDKSKVKRVLVITLSNIGDIVLTTPVVEALLSEFPDAKLDVMAGPGGIEIFEKNTRLSRAILYDKKASSAEKFKLFLRLRKRRYDLVVDLRNTVLPLVLGARYITSPLRRAGKNAMHKTDEHLSRLRDLGIDVSGGRMCIPVPPEDEKHAEELIASLDGKPFIVISPGAKSHVKRWPLKNFAALAGMIQKNLKTKVVLIGDVNDRIVIKRILFNMKSAPLNLAEKTNIRELAHIIKKSRLLITNDSAPLHIAGAVGARILAFFGPTDDRQYGPAAGSASKVLRKDMECSPCKVPQCINTENKYECLKSISAEDAFRAVKELV